MHFNLKLVLIYFFFYCCIFKSYPKRLNMPSKTLVLKWCVLETRLLLGKHREKHLKMKIKVLIHRNLSPFCFVHYFYVSNNNKLWCEATHRIRAQYNVRCVRRSSDSANRLIKHINYNIVTRMQWYSVFVPIFHVSATVTTGNTGQRSRYDYVRGVRIRSRSNEYVHLAVSVRQRFKMHPRTKSMWLLRDVIKIYL